MRAAAVKGVTLALLLALPLGWPSPARAQSADPPTAHELYERGLDAYRSGRYAEAASLLKKTYELEPEPVLLYDWALACEKLGDFACASAALADYVAAADPPDRAELEQRIAAYRRKLTPAEPVVPAAAAASRPVPSAPTAPAPPEGRGTSGASAPSNPLPWVLVGAGVATIGTGVGLGIAARNRNEDAERNPVQASAAEDASSARSLAGAATGTLIAGGVLVGVGLVWVLVRGRGATASASPNLGGHAVLVWGPRSVSIALPFLEQ